MMQWHIVCRVGRGDAHAPDIPPDEPRIVMPIDQPGQPREVASHVLLPFREQTNLPVSAVAADLLNCAVAVYAADLRVQRKYSENRWSRSFLLHLPVHDVRLWSRAAGRLVQALGFLTGDEWAVQFRETGFEPNPPVKMKKGAVLIEKPDTVGLFSGGLDSFVGAVDALESGKRALLVGHYGAGITGKVQNDVVGMLKEHYKDLASSSFFYVQPPRIANDDGEPTMRSRSFLFLALGTAVASAFSDTLPLCVAENGFISLNAPTTYARLGSFSTRTTHPHFMDLYRRLLSSLKVRTPLELPYRFQTKGEMLVGAKNQDVFRKGAFLTMSCAHPEAGRHHRVAPNTPCGYCVPCIIRSAAMLKAGLIDRPQRVDVHVTPPPADKKSGRDLRAFRMAIERVAVATAAELRATVLAAGPLPPEDFTEYFQMYERGIAEVRCFLAGN